MYEQILMSIAFNAFFLLLAIQDAYKGKIENWKLLAFNALAVITAIITGHAITYLIIPYLVILFLVCMTGRMGWADFYVYFAIGLAYPAALAYTIVVSVLAIQGLMIYKKQKVVRAIPIIFFSWAVITTLIYDLPSIYHFISSTLQ